MQRLKKYLKNFVMINRDGGGGQFSDFMGNTAVMRGDIELMGVPPVPSPMPGRIGLKFDIFELMFYEVLVMHIHNGHLVYNFYEQAIKLLL